MLYLEIEKAKLNGFNIYRWLPDLIFQDKEYLFSVKWVELTKLKPKHKLVALQLIRSI